MQILKHDLENHFSKKRKVRTVIVPLLFSTFVVLITLAGWQWQRSSTNNRINSITKVTAEQLALRLEAFIDSRVQVVSYLAEYVPARGKTENDYSKAAQDIIDNYSGFQALNWIDSDRIIQIVVPFKGNEPALGKNLTNHPSPSVRDAINRADHLNRAQRTSRINLLQGGSGFAAYLPVRDDSGKSLGFINTVFRVDDLVRSCYSEETLWDQYSFCFAENKDELIFSHGIKDFQDPPRFTNSVTVRIVDKHWTLKIAPSDSYLPQLQSRDSMMFLVGGLIFAVVVFVFARLLMIRHESLKIEETKYRSLFEGSRDAIFISTVESSFHDVNQAMVDMFGYSREELIILAPVSLYADAADRTTMLNALLIHGHVAEYEVKLKRKNGQEINCQTSATMSNSRDGKTRLIRGIIRDVTEKRELEKQYLQSQKMEAIGRLAGGIAHDFNNLLTAIVGNAELARMRIGSNHSVIEELDDIIETSDRATKLTRQLLAFSRKQIIQPINVDLDESLMKTARILQRVLGEDILLSFVHNPVKGVINADPAQLEQVILNLAVNARDAMPNGGSLIFTTSNVKVSDENSNSIEGRKKGQYVLLTAVDTGHGMSMETRSRIFEPFFPTKEETKGTGLGLATVYGIVSQNNGFIDVKSTEDIGTTFEIYFPRIIDREADESSEDMASAAERGNEKILIVEDDDAVRELTKKILINFGYEVFQASNAKEAINYCDDQEFEIDLLLTDVVMPGISGPEMVDSIKQTRSELKTLFMSGYTEATILDQGIPKDDIYFISKPFHSNELAKRIREVLDQN